MYQSGYWLAAQLCAALLGICLPTLRPIVPGGQLAISIRNLYASLLARRSRSTKSTSEHSHFTNKRSDREYGRLSEGDSKKNLTHVAAVKNPSFVETDIPLNAIHVTRDVDLA